MVHMNPKDIVRAGYDRVSYAYRPAQDDNPFAEYTDWLRKLVALLPPAAAVLDLGCGCGVPVAQLLVGYKLSVTGVDLSPVQVERAQALLPEAQFLCADMTDVAFPRHTFEAVVSFYALIHVPVAEQPAVFATIHHWLKPSGYFMGTVGHQAWTGTEQNWLDVEDATMYWSHADAETYRQWLVQSGFRVCWTHFVPEGSGGHTLILAQAVP